MYAHTGYFVEQLINKKLITENLVNKSNRLSFVDKINLLEDNNLLSKDIYNELE